MAQEYLMRWPTSTGNRKTFTWAGWIKYLVDSNTRQGFFSCDDGSGHSTLEFDGKKMMWNTASFGWSKSAEEFRDFNGWSHVVFVHDTTQDQAEDRLRLWVNGAQCRFSDDSNMANWSQHAETNHNYVNVEQYFAVQHGGGNHWFEGYMMDVYYIDGLALRPEDFGYFKRGKGVQNISNNARTTEHANGKWAPSLPRVVKEKIKSKGGFGVNGGYYPMNFGSNPGLDFQEIPDTILKINTHEQQPKGGLYEGRIEVREDPLKDHLILAVPGVDGGLDDGLGDYSHLIKGSGAPCPITTKSPLGVSTATHSALWYGSSMYYNNSGCNAYTIPALGTDEFCIEFWSKRKHDNGFSANGSHGFFSIGSVNANGALTWAIENANLWLRGYNDSGSAYVNILNTGSHTWKDRYYPPGQWTHTAIVRSKNQHSSNMNYTIYINGAPIHYSQAQSYNNDDLTYTYCAIGAISDGASYPWEGSISDFRIYKGHPKYRGGFTCPKPYHMRQGSGYTDWSDNETWRVTPDTPENNYAVWTNSLGTGHSGGDTQAVHLEGNLYSRWRNQCTSCSSLGMATGTGKWYAEYWVANNAYCPYIGVTGHNRSGFNFAGYYNNAGWSGIALGYGSNTANSYRKSWIGGLTQGGTNPPPYYNGNGQIVAFALDTDKGILDCYVNNELVYTATDLPHIGGTSPNNDTPDHLRFMALRTNDGASPAGSDWGEVWANFGQNPTFTDKKIDDPGTFTDANGRGLFYYQPPAGCKALCTANFPEPDIPVPTEYFKAFRYNGDSSTSHSLTGVGFQPDLCWHAIASNADYWIGYDSVQGPAKAMYLTANSAAFTGSQGLQLKSFDEDGATLGEWSNINYAGRTYNGYYWKAGGNKSRYNYNDQGWYTRQEFEAATGVNITSGTVGTCIPPIGCSIGTKPGLSIVEFEGTGSSGDIPHGLGKEPYFIIIKKASAAGNSWAVYHKYVGSGKQLLLNSSNGVSNDANGFDADADDKVVHVGSGAAMATNQTGTNIMYAWAEVEGFSKFGMYYGNNNADGPHIYCGFRPAFVICKRADASADHWCNWNSSHNPWNPITCQMNINLSNAEICNSNAIEISSTGFKHIGPVGTRTNGNGVFYIYAAWAECPTKYANTLR